MNQLHYVKNVWVNKVLFFQHSSHYFCILTNIIDPIYIIENVDIDFFVDSIEGLKIT